MDEEQEQPEQTRPEIDYDELVEDLDIAETEIEMINCRIKKTSFLAPFQHLQVLEC